MRVPAGVRTFAPAGLLGGIGQLSAGTTGLLLAVAVTALFATVAYHRATGDDPA